jgi:molybdenum cofactor biosynthesis enzyme MoaA
MEDIMENKLVYNNTCDGYYNAMDVHFTSACDNNCNFCIDKMYTKKSYPTNINKMIKSVIRENPEIMLILGGEPFILPIKLLEFVNGIRGYVKELYITTTLPKIFINNIALAYKIIDKINGLNISIQNIDWEKNNKILNAKYNHNRIEIMKKLIKKYPDKIRINLNLVKGGIDTKNKLNYTLNYLNDCGLKKVKINELQHTSKNYISYENIMNLKWPSAYAHGCQTFLQYKNIEILVKRACFLTEDTNKATIKDIFKILIQLLFSFKKKKYRVLWENGKITNTWRQNAD